MAECDSRSDVGQADTMSAGLSAKQHTRAEMLPRKLMNQALSYTAGCNTHNIQH